jgi:hypothetical protein
MRALVLFLFACVLSPAYARDFPTDGNGLLDACSVLVDAADKPSYIPSLSGHMFIEKMGQINWCAGYLGATQDILLQNHVNLGIMAMAGLKLCRPDKIKQYVFDALKGPCIPDDATPLQLARVLVKWLHEHPGRLHELKSPLTMAALTDAFPCQQAAPKEATKPTTVKP